MSLLGSSLSPALENAVTQVIRHHAAHSADSKKGGSYQQVIVFCDRNSEQKNANPREKITLNFSDRFTLPDLASADEGSSHNIFFAPREYYLSPDQVQKIKNKLAQSQNMTEINLLERPLYSPDKLPYHWSNDVQMQDENPNKPSFLAKVQIKVSRACLEQHQAGNLELGRFVTGFSREYASDIREQIKSGKKIVIEVNVSAYDMVAWKADYEYIATNLYENLVNTFNTLGKDGLFTRCCQMTSKIDGSQRGNWTEYADEMINFYTENGVQLSDAEQGGVRQLLPFSIQEKLALRTIFIAIQKIEFYEAAKKLQYVIQQYAKIVNYLGGIEVGSSDTTIYWHCKNRKIAKKIYHFLQDHQLVTFESNLSDFTITFHQPDPTEMLQVRTKITALCKKVEVGQKNNQVAKMCADHPNYKIIKTKIAQVRHQLQMQQENFKDYEDLIDPERIENFDNRKLPFKDMELLATELDVVMLVLSSTLKNQKPKQHIAHNNSRYLLANNNIKHDNGSSPVTTAKALEHSATSIATLTTSSVGTFLPIQVRSASTSTNNRIAQSAVSMTLANAEQEGEPWHMAVARSKKAAQEKESKSPKNRFPFLPPSPTRPSHFPGNRASTNPDISAKSPSPAPPKKKEGPPGGFLWTPVVSPVKPSTETANPVSMQSHGRRKLNY